MAQKRSHSSLTTDKAIAGTSTSADQDIYQSDPIHDRASVFIGLFSSTVPWKTLQQHNSVTSAMHRIAAWRLPSKQRTIANSFGSSHSSAVGKFDIGHDDDGEKGAGIRLGRLLEQEGVVGSAVVGRWWGGVMLGPVRFTWIENVAKEAIVRWTAAQTGAGDQAREQQGQQKRVKTGNDRDGGAVVHDERSRAILIEELERRDRNIIVLRNLLRDKKEKLESESGSPSTKNNATPSPAAKPPDYTSLPMARLLALDKARDATMSYILKDLDKVDQMQREEDELDDAIAQVADDAERKVDEAAFDEMDKFEKEEQAAKDEAEAFEQMERIAEEIEQKAMRDGLAERPKQHETPKTPDYHVRPT